MLKERLRAALGETSERELEEVFAHKLREKLASMREIFGSGKEGAR